MIVRTACLCLLLTAPAFAVERERQRAADSPSAQTQQQLEKRIARLNRKLDEARRELKALQAKQAEAARSASAPSGPFRSENFIVTCSDAALAKEIGETAERLRKALAADWLGNKLPPWEQPCTITVKQAPQSRGAATTYLLKDGHASGFSMKLEGSRHVILKEVLRHEVLHTVLATHFGRKLPRWADEGAAISEEPAARHAEYDGKLKVLLLTGKGMPFREMFQLHEYPRDISPFFVQSQSVVRFLLQRGGRRTFVEFLDQGLRSDDWDAALRKHYDYKSPSALQEEWTDAMAETTARESRPAEAAPEGVVPAPL